MTVCVVVGAGAQGRVTLEAWRAERPHARFVLLDDDAKLHGTTLLDVKVEGGLDQLGALSGQDSSAESCEVIVALGNNETRLALTARLESSVKGLRWGTAIHPSAVVMPSARIGGGTVVLAGAIVNTDACIGAHVVVNTGVIVEHDCIIEDGASLSPGTKMGGRVKVGRGAFVSTGVTLAPRVSVGAGAVIGAGAVVTSDIAERVLAYGVPARVVKPIAASFDWRRLL